MYLYVKKWVLVSLRVFKGFFKRARMKDSDKINKLFIQIQIF